MIDGSHGCAAWRDPSPKLGHHPPTEEPVLPPSEALYGGHSPHQNEWTWKAECPLDKLLQCVNEQFCSVQMGQASQFDPCVYIDQIHSIHIQWFKNVGLSSCCVPVNFSLPFGFPFCAWPLVCCFFFQKRRRVAHEYIKKKKKGAHGSKMLPPVTCPFTN